MSRVQSVLTYTVPAKCPTESSPPPAPIRCGCDDFLLILEDRSLLQTSLRGILRTEIKSVTVSSAPVSYVDGGSGATMLVWKYDYVIEYDDADLTDTSYRVRKCDIAYNCCYSCGQSYTDRQLEGYVQFVTGTNVNNTDPQNPIVNIPDSPAMQVTASQSINLLASGLLNHQLQAEAIISPNAGNQLSVLANGMYVPPVVIPPQGTDSLVDIGGRLLRHTAVNGVVTDFNQGISSVVGLGGVCEGVGPAFAIKQAFLSGNQIVLAGALEHTSSQASSQVQGGGGILSAVGQSVAAPTLNVVINNPSVCRNYSIYMNVIGRMFGQHLTGATALVGGRQFLSWSINAGPSNSNSTSYHSFRPTGSPAVSFYTTVNWTIVDNIPPAGAWSIAIDSNFAMETRSGANNIDTGGGVTTTAQYIGTTV
jgi:hypothetical protein